MQHLNEINFEQTKQRLNLEFKPIKKLLLYNYINDDFKTLIIDCRTSNIEFPQVQKDKNFALRLILILKDNTDIKTDQNLESVRNFVKEHDELTQGLFFTYESNYNDFISSYPFLNETKYEVINQFHLPICGINDIIYAGGFINSKNKVNLSLLKIQTVISIMAEDDKELISMFGENYRNFEHDESIHDEVDFTDIVDFCFEQINKKKNPILIYCFSGKSASLAALAAFLMAYKKWPLQLAVGYVLKLSPCLNIPSWLFTQLQRWDVIKKEDKSK